MKKLFTIICSLLLTHSALTQLPGWIEQELSETMNGTCLASKGDDLLIFTKSNSDIIYFFDTNQNAWSSLSFSNSQKFEKVLADSQTAFAYSDEYIVGYSSILSQCDTVKYQGDVLDPRGVSVRKGFGCAGKLAYFATSANIFYVFDAELAQWKSYDYGNVLNANGTNSFWAADTYAGAIFQRNGYDFAKNIAYSLNTHSFAEIDQGGWYHYVDRKMTGGFVSQWSDAKTTAKYFAYASKTNEFKHISMPMGYDKGNFEAWVDNYKGAYLDEINLYICGYSVGDQFYRDRYVYIFSTETGKWFTYHHSFDPREYYYSLGWKCGGSIALGYYMLNDDDYTVGVWKYYGDTETYIGEMPHLYKEPGFVLGGKVAAGSGKHNMWFHNFNSGQSKNVYFQQNDYSHISHFAAENYAATYRYIDTSDVMKIYFFNGRTNELQSLNAYKIFSTGSSQKATPKVYALWTRGLENNEVIFYSEEKDTLIKYYAPESYGSTQVINNLALHTTQNYTILFDASTATIHERNFTLSFSGCFGDSILFASSGDSELTIYNAIKKEWCVKHVDQLLYAYAGNVIGLGVNQTYNKYWGYSAYQDDLYELEPEGSYVSPGNMVGGKTAIVIRSSKIYAFSPGLVVSNDKMFNSEKDNMLMCNYPNPFTTSTSIKYTISPSLIAGSHAGTHVYLKVYNFLGKHISTLVDGYRTTGTYETEFHRNELSSGLYFYTIQTSGITQTKLMIIQ